MNRRQLLTGLLVLPFARLPKWGPAELDAEDEAWVSAKGLTLFEESWDGMLCAPYAPTYDFFRLAEPQRVVEPELPAASAPRGEIRYIDKARIHSVSIVPGGFGSIVVSA